MLGLAFLTALDFKAVALPVVQLTRSMRILAYPSDMKQFLALRLSDDLLPRRLHRDPYFFINHKHYLSKFFRPRERIHNAVFHYKHEKDNFDEAFRACVYGSNGLVLWHEEAGGNRFHICIVATDDNRVEGDVSVILWVNGNSVCRMSYSIVDAASFGIPCGPILFITRNQVSQGPELDVFREAFPQNSPPYFCFAAISGIASANGFKSVAAIKSEAQLAYQAKYEVGFRNSYCKFWLQFGAKEIDHQAYLIEVPPVLPPISSIKSKHRGRANNRRRHWAKIMYSAQHTVYAHLIEPKLPLRMRLPSTYPVVDLPS
jgi:uncharacterized protein VirK/YbjX